MSEVQRITLKKSRDDIIEDEVDYEEDEDEDEDEDEYQNEAIKKAKVEDTVDNIQDNIVRDLAEEDKKDNNIETTNTERTKTCHEKIDILISNDKRFGFPNDLVNIPVFDHGWFRPGNVELLDLLLEKDMKCVIELGSWLGKSTKFLLDRTPNAALFAIDIWSNEYFLNDSHYDKTSEVFSSIINGSSIYDQFLINTKKYKAKKVFNSNDNTNEYVGLIPCKLDSCEALRILKDNNVNPDLIYIDANLHYDPVVADVTTCLELFPNAIITGGDWDNKDVRNAVTDVSRKYNKQISISRGTCWTFNTDLYNEKKNLKIEKERKLKDEIEKRKEKSKITKGMSIKELAEYYKNNK